MKESLPPPAQQPRKRPSSNKKKQRKLLALYVLLGIIAVLLVLVAALLPRVSGPPVRLPEMNYHSQPAPDSTAPEAGKSTHRASSRQESTSPDARRVPAGPEAVQPAAYRRPTRGGKLIFVIDDVGNNVEELRPFLSIPGPLTLSIMPQRPFSLECYRLILNSGKTPILHQPMQADGNENPGPGAIYTSMTKQQVDETLKRNLEGMDAIRWVNNHEGSKATSNIDTMTYVLSYLEGRGMHFLDSRTSRATEVKNASLRLGLPYYRRNSYFLDNVVNKADIMKEIDSGLQVAQKEGYAVMIGHVWDKDLASILTTLYPKLTADGYEITSIESLRRELSGNASTGN